MKTILSVLLLTIFFSSSKLYAQFSNNVYIESSSNNYARKIQTLDANRDGKKDILILNQGVNFDYINLYLQDSLNQFQKTNFPNFSNLNSKYFKTAKIDKDIFDDIITVQGNHYELAWFKNESNGFSQKILINDTTNRPSEIYVADIDKDGNQDLLVLQHTEVVIYWQDNANNFSAPQVIHSGTEFYSICLVDINNDGYEDVLAGSGGFEILLNNKNRSFALQTQHWGNSLNFNIEAADVDNDGDQDVFTWETLQGIYCYFNNGTGLNFHRDTVYKSTENFKSIQVIKSVENRSYVATTLGQLGKIITITSYPQTGFREYIDHHQETGALLYTMMADDLNNDGIDDLIWGERKAGVLYGETAVLGISTINKSNINVYPNPSNGEVMLENNEGKNLSIKVFDLYGRLVTSVSVPAHTKENLLITNSGIYFLQYIDEKNILHSEKLIIK